VLKLFKLIIVIVINGYSKLCLIGIWYSMCLTNDESNYAITKRNLN